MSNTPFVDPTWDNVDTYYSSLYVQQDSILEATLQASKEAGLPPHNVSPLQGKFLQLLVQLKGAKRILEIGTLGGYSTIWFARAESAQQVVTLEVDEICAKVAQNNIILAGLQDKVNIKLGRALDSLDEMIMNNEAPFDFVFIDADKINNCNYYERAMKLSRSGTVIIADNVVRDGKVTIENKQDLSVTGVRAFNELVSKDERVSTTALQTVGCKGYDGFAMLLVK
ncbi:putative O-methyltransferase [Backusella circina FSU 941]|nr:putative O-methyltransferase [Backusella circina FSU 941]